VRARRLLLLLLLLRRSALVEQRTMSAVESIPVLMAATGISDWSCARACQSVPP